MLIILSCNSKYRILQNMRLTKYLSFNEEKIAATLAVLSTPKREAVKSIPFFLHYPIVAPFLNATVETPCGIFDFDPSQDALDMFNRTWGLHISNKTHKPEVITIETLIAIGSFGTVAFKETSDIDYWVVVRNDTVISQLIEKCVSLEIIYRERFDLEVHFFVMTCDDVINNNFGTVDEESAGSSLATLLKEEFYRTATYFAGKFPRWYLDEKEIASLDETTIDLGEISHFSSEEFYGAAIWLLLKGTKAPLKSIVKLSLMNMLLTQLPNLEWPASQYKLNVEHSTSYQDAHIFIYNRILTSYLHTTTGKIPPLTALADLEMGKSVPEYASIRRYYVLSIAVYLSLNTLFRQKNVLDKIFPILPFTRDFIKKLDAYGNWQINEYLELNTHTTEFIFSVYQSIRKLSSTDKKIISDIDLTIISRKLATQLLRKKNKIMNYSILPILPNERMFIINETKYGYALFKNNVQDNNILFASESPIAIAAWMITNNFVFESIQLRINSPSGKLNKKSFEFIMKKAQRFLATLPKPDTSDYLSEPYYLALYILINFNSTENSTLNDIQLLIFNSWGEISEFTVTRDVEYYIFERLLPQIRPQTHIVPDFLDLYHQRHDIEQQLLSYFISLKKLFVMPTHSALFITEIRKKFIIVSRQGESIKCGSTSSPRDLFALLGSFDVKNKKNIEFSSTAHELQFLSLLYHNTPDDTVSLFLAEYPPLGLLCIIDEQRTLFSCYFKKEHELDVLYRYRSLLESSLKRSLSIFRIMRDTDTMQIRDMTSQYSVLMHTPPKKYIPIKIHIKNDTYTFLLPKTHIVTTKDNLAELKKHVSAQDPPFFTEVGSDQPLTTAEKLFLVNTIEKRLES